MKRLKKSTTEFKVGDELYYGGFMKQIPPMKIIVIKIEGEKVFYIDDNNFLDWIHITNLRKLTKLEQALK